MGSASFDFEDETVLVTGAASGIGREIARRFGEAGASVLVADVRETPRDEGETIPEFIEELLNVFETEGAFLQEGYSE